MNNAASFRKTVSDVDAIMAKYPSGSPGSSRSSGSKETPQEIPDGTGRILDEIYKWIETYVRTVSDQDYVLLTLWIAHTHLAKELYNTPRLLIDSTLPGSGKTTLLDHLERLCYNPVQAASLSSPALLSRLVAQDPRTILIDEADRTLDPKGAMTGELLAIINSGYRFGSKRPTLVPDKEEGWVAKEFSTYCPLAIAGNTPNLPPDTMSRCTRVLLMPDLDGVVEDSDWEFIEADAKELYDRLATWADQVREQVRVERPKRHERLRGRNRERWEPLLRVAAVAGGNWDSKCRELIDRDIEAQEEEKEAGFDKEPRHMTLLRDISEHWPTEAGEPKSFAPSQEILVKLQMLNPTYWGSAAPYGELKIQGMGRMLNGKFGLMSKRLPGGNRERGYFLADFQTVWGRFGMTPTS